MNIPTTLTIADVLGLSPGQLASLTKQQRWQLIDQLDQHTDHLQQTIRVLSKQRIDCTSLRQEYNQTRMKRVLIWLGFWPGVALFVHRANEIITA